MHGIPVQLQSGFWLGIGFALAYLVWGMVQMLIARGAERAG